MDFHSLRRQPCRALLLMLVGSSVVLVYLNQTHLPGPLRTDPSPPPLQYTLAHRRIQDYRSPEYTAPGDTAPSQPQPQDPPPQGQLLIEIPKQELKEEQRKKEIIKKEEVTKKNKPVNEKEEETQGREEYLEETAIREETGDREIYTGERRTNDDGEISEPRIEEETARREETQEEEKLNQDEKEETRIEREEAREDNVRREDDKKEDDKREEARRDDVIVDDNMRDDVMDDVTYDAMNKSVVIASILGDQREILAREMVGYQFHPKLKVKGVDGLVLEKGGRPVRSLVVTTWRSGSTFIGDVLTSHPGTYYHYEPLLDFGIRQVRHGQDARQALDNIRRLLNCDYDNMEHYLDYGPDHPWLFVHNEPLWRRCQQHPDLCWDKHFLSPFCSLFPFQSLKTVRLRLNLTQELLEDDGLGVQILLLVRDPRGTIQSRHHRDWCPGQPDCEEPARLCADLVSDYNTAIKLRRKYPNRFRAVRYEDLSFDAYNMTRELFQFFHLAYHPRVEAFLDTHTKVSMGGVSSTFRNSKTAPVHWQQDLSWQEVQDIQGACGKALRLWGYNVAKDEAHLRSFMPVGTLRFH